MDRGIDLSTLTARERGVFTLGLLVFVNTLIPWWYRIRTPGGTYFHNGGLRGWGIVAAFAGFAAALVVVARHVRTPAAFDDRIAYPALGAVAVGAMAVQGLRAQAIWIGYWFGIALAACLALAGLARLRERRRGWI